MCYHIGAKLCERTGQSSDTHERGCFSSGLCTAAKADVETARQIVSQHTLARPRQEHLGGTGCVSPHSCKDTGLNGRRRWLFRGMPCCATYGGVKQPLTNSLCLGACGPTSS